MVRFFVFLKYTRRREVYPEREAVEGSPGGTTNKAVSLIWYGFLIFEKFTKKSSEASEYPERKAVEGSPSGACPVEYFREKNDRRKYLREPPKKPYH